METFINGKIVDTAEERKEFYAHFAAVESKYLGLEYNKRSVYVAIIAQNPFALIHEGELLHHCVGRMGYDQKFAREEKLIFLSERRSKPILRL